MQAHATKSQRASRRKQPADMHPAMIVALLRISGWTLRRLSVAHGLKATTLSDALRKPWPRGERIIAEAIGRSPESIWPSRYVIRAARKAKA
jgi:Ner family transcriptional regulator